MENKGIKHMVIFCLNHSKNSNEADKFLRDGREILTSIPAVRNFEVFNQISIKNDYDFGFSMEFEDQAAYEAYNSDPRHVGFVRDRWEKEVTKFLEIDFKSV